MAKLFSALTAGTLASMALATGGALAATPKDGGQPSVVPCREHACARAVAERVEPAEQEAVVIFLDAEGRELTRVPLSRLKANGGELPEQPGPSGDR